MPRVRKITRLPKEGKYYYIVDACFLANKYIDVIFAPSAQDKEKIHKCMKWWEEIDAQLENEKAIVYIPDICIAETFKTLAKKYYQDKWFKDWKDFDKARRSLRNNIRIYPKDLARQKRVILYHDIPTDRDIIIAVDRFYEIYLKKNLYVSLPDLVILATAKYLMDFFNLPRQRINIITLDSNLRDGTKGIAELPNAYDPTSPEDQSDRVFKS